MSDETKAHEEHPKDGAGTVKRTAGLMPPWKPGQTGNPKGSNQTQRMRAAIRRELKKRMEEGDEDELSPAARWFVDLMATCEEPAQRVALLKELRAIEDGPHQTRIAGPNGEAIEPLVLFNVDREAMRLGRPPEQCPDTPSEAPPSS